jgi:putative spermidine/putrescine transport system substrate-binding protein
MKQMCSRRHVLKGMAALAGAGAAGLGAVSRAAAQRRFEGETLRVQFWAGPEGQTIRSGAVEPFIRKTGARLVVTEGVTTLSLAKMRAEKANPSTTVYLVDEVGVVTAGREGLLEPLDLARLPNAVDIQPRFFVEGKGVGFFTYITALVYNTNLVKTPPTSWKALWDVQYKGKVAIPPAGHGSSYQLAIIAAMLNGGSQYNMDPAWEALKALKANVGYMEVNTATLAELMRNGDLAIAMRLPYYFKEYIEKGYPIGIALGLREGLFATAGCATIAKGHPDKGDVAEAFINELLSAEAQRRMADLLWFGPTNRRVRLSPTVARNLMSTQEEWDSIIPVNLDNLAARREEWIQKYTRALVG